MPVRAPVEMSGLPFYKRNPSGLEPAFRMPAVNLGTLSGTNALPARSPPEGL